MSTSKEGHWRPQKADKTKRRGGEQTKRNRKFKRPRRRDWMPDNLDDLEALDEFGFSQYERIVPRGERERRQAITAAMLADLEEEMDAEEL